MSPKNILFLTILGFDSVEEQGIYTDLLRKFRDEGHRVYVLSPSERRSGKKKGLFEENGITHVKVRTLNFQKTNVFEKGLAITMMEHQYLRAIRKYFRDIKFDLILYSTPPITYTKVVKYIRARDGALSYLLLKDIFPQNAVDLGLLKKNGSLHRYFRKKETELYKNSDVIGCMSPANAEYLIRNNDFGSAEKVEVNPNSMEVVESDQSETAGVGLRKKHGIPEEATVFIYGGNLGKPQGIDFLMEVVEHHRNRRDVFFVIAGSGTEFERTREWLKRMQLQNTLLLHDLTKGTYDELLSVCDVGLIFLDKRFTIPNYPSRLLSYLQKKMPVLAATDRVSDVGKTAEENGFGFWVLSGDMTGMKEKIGILVQDPQLRESMGRKGFAYLKENFSVERSYEIIMRHFRE